MWRFIDGILDEWKARDGRKPLVLLGARQVGKTYALKAFGLRQFRATHYLNFQERPELAEIFTGNLSSEKLLQGISFVLDTSIHINEDLLILDEIQDCPAALTSLKYFCENLPQLAICAAGSLLGVSFPHSPFPVGKVEFQHMFPLTFEEFLVACDKRGYTAWKPISATNVPTELVHRHLMACYREYLVVGGLPEVVAMFASQKGSGKPVDFASVRTMQNALLSAYFRDIAKYCGKVNASIITAVLESIPRQLAREHKKFVATVVAPGSRFARLQSAVDWLVHAGLLLRTSIVNNAEIPFSAFSDLGTYKLYMFDTGLLGALSGTSPGAILNEADPFKTFKGAIAENYVAQEFTAAGHGLFCWMGTHSEIEFLREVDGKIYPIEVKSGVSGKLKSLQVFSEKYHCTTRVRISAQGLQLRPQDSFLNLPLYLAGQRDASWGKFFKPHANMS